MARRPDSNDADSDDLTEHEDVDAGGAGQSTEEHNATNEGRTAGKGGLTEGNDGHSTEKDDRSAGNDGESDERSMLVDRRQYVGLLGGAAAAAVGLGAASSASAAEYELVELGEGETFTRSLGSGDTLENVLIDVRANNADVHISASGSDWTVRNVGIRGKIDIGDDSPGGDNSSYEGGYGQVFNMQVTDGDGSALMENIYVGDGIEAGVDKSCMNVSTNHRGHLDVRNVNVGGFSTTCFYISGFGREGTGGTMTIEDSYFENSSSAHIRPAGNVTIRNCVITNTDEVVYLPRTFGGLEQAITSRGIWTSYSGSTTLVENCDIDIRESNTCNPPWSYSGPCQANAVWASEAAVDVVDSEVRGSVGGNVNQSNVGSEPDLSLPDGCPSDAEVAAGGGSSGGSGNSSGGNDHSVISISGGSGSNKVNYALEVTDTVEKGDRANPEESVSDATATGYVIGGTDSFQFLGEVADFSADGELTVAIDGQTVDPNELASGDSYRTDDQSDGSEDEPVLSREIRISGGSQSEQVDYTFTVSEAVAKGDRANSEESVSDNTASGYVIGGTDSFDFAGEITNFDATGDLTITVDGEEVDQAELGDSGGDSGNEQSLPNGVRLSGGSMDDPVEYEFTVSEAVAKGDRANSEESVSNTTASGYVVGGTDSFEFAGEITSFEANGDLTITINGEEVAQEDLGASEDDGPELDRELRVSGGSQSNQVDYSFTVSDAVAKGDRANSEESVSDTSASGYVIGGTDSFKFAGELEHFDATGAVTLVVDGETVDPDEFGDDQTDEVSLDREVRISGGSTSNKVNYSFEVSEAVAKGSRANSEESVSGTSASGYVIGGTDSFDFAGEIVDFDASGDLTITVDGEEVDQEDLGDEQTEEVSLDREIRISGGSQSNQANYTFTVSEAVAKGGRANSEESVSGRTASGYVVGGTDSFEFAGEVTSFESSDDVSVTIDGESVDLGQTEEPPELTEEVRLSGGSLDNPVNYEFTVSEAVAKGSRANSEESVSGRTASGYVVGGTDSFDFAGEITSFEADGDLTVTVNGSEVDL